MNEEHGKVVRHFRDLKVYRLAFSSGMSIFRLSKSWPKDERFSLIDQIRRSSRSTCGSIAEAWRKRRYPAHFVSKLSDADSEAAETQSWLDFARACEYITEKDYKELDETYEKIGGGLVKMMDNKDRWCGPSRLVRENLADYDETA